MTQLTDREIDAACAEKVMGITHIKPQHCYQDPSGCGLSPYDPDEIDMGGFDPAVHPCSLINPEQNAGGEFDVPSFYRPIPFYTTSASDDYRVLEHVRGEWNERLFHLFQIEITAIWREQVVKATQTSKWLQFAFGAHYRPGDYARAALAVLEAK